MRTLAFLIPALFLGAAALVATPPADAVGICSGLTDDRCDGYLVCVGYRWDSYGFRCTGYGIPWGPCTCPPPQEYFMTAGILP